MARRAAADADVGPSERPAKARRTPARRTPVPAPEAGNTAELLQAALALSALADLLGEGDDLRTVTLVARDVANLARALGASSQEMSSVWRAVAELHCGAPAGATLGQHLQAVKAAVKEDSARSRKIVLTSAKAKYRLSDAEVKSLPILASRPNP